MKKQAYTKVRFAKSFVAILLALVCVITLLPEGSLIAQASTTEDVTNALIDAPSVVKSSSNALWVNGSNYSKDNGLDAIKWHYSSSDGKYYLYLPSSVDLNQLTVWHTFSGSMYVNGTKIQSGETTNIFAGGGNYTVKAGSTQYNLVVMQSQNINTMFITTSSGNLDAVNSSTDKSKVDSGDIVYVDTEGNAATVALSQIKGRGNSSWEAAQRLFYKYPYNIKLDKKTALFGMKKSKKWCLLANDFDQSLIRNKFIFDLAKDAGAPYTPEGEYADVYQNGRYIGNYLITSKVEVDENRIDVFDLEGETEDLNSQDLEDYSRGGSIGSKEANTYKYVNIPNNPSDITGGYLLEFELDERYPNEVSGFVSSKRQQVVVKSPEYASKEQVKYIKSYFQSMENAVYSSNGYNSEGKHYTEYLDLKTAAQMYIIQELAMNVDAVSTSFNLYKDKGGKIYFGPAWDFDWAIGGYDRSDLLNTSKLLLTSKKVYHGSELNFMGALTKHSEFMDMVKKVWKEDFSPLLSVSTGSKAAYTANVKAIKAYGSEIKSSANMNFSRFKFLGTTNWGSKNTGSTFNENVNYVHNFIKKRVTYLNSVWGSGSNNNNEKTTVYFDNSNAKWSNVYAYVWNDTTDFAVFSGSKVSGTNVYKFTVNGSYSSILFKNTDGTESWDKQTLDLEMPADANNCYKANSGSKSGGSWYEYKEPTQTPVVTAEPTPVVGGNTATVYYKSNWSQANIHYSVNGQWTSVPGVAMTATTEQSGYNWKYVINLGSATTATVCFNNGSNWDSNNSSNYEVKAGTYGVKDGVVYELQPVVVTSAPTVVPGTETIVYFDNSNAKWSKVYAYVWNDTTDYKLVSWVSGGCDIYKFEIKGSYKYILFKNTGDTTTWELQTPDLLMPTTNAIYYKPDNGSNKASGSWYEAPIVTTTPSETPIVTETPTVEPVTPTPTVVPGKNKAVVYYQRSTTTSWTNAYIHYKVNGQWTTAPGVKMEKISAGYWSYTIDLGTATEATVCFNNGNGTWDNKDKANYTLKVGTSLVYDGKVTPDYKPVTTTPTVTETPTVQPVTPTPTVVPAGKAVVYYQRSTTTSWTNAYIHYKVNGQWTNSPGVKMEKLSAGYWKYTIDLGTATEATACFNNGNGTWDNKDKANYTLKAGTSLVYEGKVTPDYKPVTTTPEVTPVVTPVVTPTYVDYVTVAFDNSVSKWDEVYAYVWNNTEDYKVFTPAYITGKTAVFNITGSYKNIIFKNTAEDWDQQTADLTLPAYTTSTDGKCFTPSSAKNKSEGTWGNSVVLDGRVAVVPSVSANKDTLTVGDAVKFTMTAEYGNGHYLNARYLTFTYEDGTYESVNSFDYPSYATSFEKIADYTHTYSWTPKKAGKVKVTYSVSEYEDHTETSQAITLNVKAAGNTLKIYYKNSNWSKAYVHYKVNGTWTNVPGMQMQASDRSDCKWMYTIDLGTATSATVCFNDGNSTWDNNNKNNYVLNKGTYKISGGTITKLAD